ncbi:MAG: DCC1-like thiol-disulfide oxidoreductase family protein [Nitrospirota bacterium]|jgi:predicted DCC family thiol-disulfide oxidoreductase YuxK
MGSTPPDAHIEGDGPIVFFDGVCGLCNRFVDWVIARDRHARYRFAPLQGETAAAMGVTPKAADPALWSIVFVDGSGARERSDAVLTIATGLGGIYRTAAVLRWVPRPVRDWLYDRIARRRYRFFGKRDACRMPTPEERDRFLP